MGKSITRPNTERVEPKRTVEVSDGARAVMAGLTRGEKDAIEAALRSATALLRVPVDYVVNAPSGDMYTARVTDDLRLIYQLRPDRIDVIDLLSAGAVEFMIGPNLVPGPTDKPRS